MTVRPLIAAASIVLVLVPSVACDLAVQARPEGMFERTLEVRGPVTLDVGTGSGSIEITRGPAESVRVIGRIRAGFRAGVDAEVQSRTGSGNQTVTDVRGPVDAQAGSGGIVIRRIDNDVRTSTGSGTIQAEDVGGAFVGRAGSGTIDLEGRPGQDWDVTSASGSIRLQLAPDSAFDLNARTASGAITTNHPLTLLGAASRRQLRGTVRGGGPSVDVSTASGSIRIE